VVLSETQGANVTRYVHSRRGIHAQEDPVGAWSWMAQDGLGSVRGVVDDALGVLWTGNPSPYGEYFSETGTRQSPYLFTGEYTDPITELVHLRARDYHPALGVFASLDPVEGLMQRPHPRTGRNPAAATG
jgi:RHS repeat-associated protein